MNNADTHNELDGGQEGVRDLKYMRAAMEKSFRQVKPETHQEIMVWLVCMITYISIHFLSKYGLSKWITPFYLSSIGFIVCYTLVTGLRLIRRQKKNGFIPQLPWRLCGIAVIIMFPIFFWDRMGLFKPLFGEAGFMYAMGLSMVIGIIGVLYEKEWLFGGVIIFAGMVLAFLIRESLCPWIILGLSTGAGIIIPAIISERNYRKQETRNEQA